MFLQTSTLPLDSLILSPAATLAGALVTGNSHRKSQAFLFTAIFEIFKKSGAIFEQATKTPGMIYYPDVDVILRLQMYFPHTTRSASRDSEETQMKLVRICFRCLSALNSSQPDLRFRPKSVDVVDHTQSFTLFARSALKSLYKFYQGLPVRQNSGHNKHRFLSFWLKYFIKFC